MISEFSLKILYSGKHLVSNNNSLFLYHIKNELGNFAYLSVHSIFETKTMKGKLYLIPTILSEEALHVIPAYIHEITKTIKIFFAENEKTTRRYLRKTGYTASFDDIPVYPLNVNTEYSEISGYIQYLKDGNDCALMSESGVPAVADPGSSLVKLCHQHDIQVVPLVGPSSILLALMASGLNGQKFLFNGYIAVKQPARNTQIKKMETEARSGITQIFIETPYRNNGLLQDVFNNCNDATQLCIARDLTGSNEKIKTKSIGEWKKDPPQMEKVPTIFLLGS